MFKLQNNHQIIQSMNNIFFILLFFTLMTISSFAKDKNYFKIGVDSFNEKNLDKAKLNFEKDIVEIRKIFKATYI